MSHMAKQLRPRRNIPSKPTTKTAQPAAGRPYAPGYGLAEDRAGLLQWAWVVKQMNKCRTFWLATIHPSNRPHVMPIWGVWVDDAFCFSTGRKSRKGTNLAANAACTVTNDDGEEAVIVEGVAEELRDPGALESLARVYKKKYKMDPRSMGEPIFRVRPQTVFGFVEKSFPKTATRWKL
jgi:nitroimidazol reductase NimA-like FMN-containing flavoprotein (pyridoxamine 5'-phosphate oxidase superfamily)